MSVKDINIKNRSYYFVNELINKWITLLISIKDIGPDIIKIDEKSNKHILIYYIGYVTNKKKLKFYSVNPLLLIFGN